MKASLLRAAAAAATATGSRADGCRLAIIGSGPAAFYTASKILELVPQARVDMYEKDPVPYGLVRFGVAPDHPEVKNVEHRFDEVASSDRFTFIGNVEVGRRLPLTSIVPHYDAVLFAYGASRDRRLGIPGEDLRGVHSAREFVGWYNGAFAHSKASLGLDRAERAVIIGQGNVALDVARLLLTPVDVLARTDIPEPVLEQLGKSRVKSVQIVGRRGPLQAAFTIKEVRELVTLQHATFLNQSSILREIATAALPRPQKRLMTLLQSQPAHHPAHAPGTKTWDLDFLLSPREFLGQAGQLSSISFERNSLDENERPLGTGELVNMPADLCFRSIGYESEPLVGLQDAGIPFDSRMHLRTEESRVLDAQERPIGGFYAAGWVKNRNAAGVIADTMRDAFQAAHTIINDWTESRGFLGVRGAQLKPGWDEVRKQVHELGLNPTHWQDWKKIEAIENSRGAALNKPREKVVSTEKVMQLLER